MADRWDRWGLGAADARRLVLARGLRSLGYGLSSVLLGIMLRDAGLSTAEVGAVLTAALLGGIWTTAAAAFLADRLGRRRLLLGFAGLMAAAGLAFARLTNPWALAGAALLGTISPTSSETAPFLSLEQAILAQVTPADRRTEVYARYNVVALLAVAGGALLAGLPALLAPPGAARLGAEHAMFLVYAALAGGAAVCFAGLSRCGIHGARRQGRPARRRWGLRGASCCGWRGCSRSTRWAADWLCKASSRSGSTSATGWI